MPAKTMEIEVNLSVKNLREIEARIKELAEENDRLKRENAECKPDWDIAPNWARYLARDISGKWHWYAAKPSWHDGYWDSSFAMETAWLSPSNEPEVIP